MRGALKETERPIRELSHVEELTLDEIEAADFADIRRLGIITGLRRRNLILTWPKIDFDQAVVRVTKGGVPRIVPLTKEAYGIPWRRQNHHPTHVFTFVASRTRECPKTGKQFIRGERYPITSCGLGSNKRKWASGVQFSMKSSINASCCARSADKAETVGGVTNWRFALPKLAPSSNANVLKIAY
jgi:hypothetical protein